jgi:hypothetical protein
MYNKISTAKWQVPKYKREYYPVQVAHLLKSPNFIIHRTQAYNNA